jgi:hypothetical protein
MTKQQKKMIRQANALVRSELGRLGYPIVKSMSAEQAVRAAIEFETIRAARFAAVLSTLRARIAENDERLRLLGQPDFTEASARLIAEAEALVLAAAYDAG